MAMRSRAMLGGATALLIIAGALFYWISTKNEMSASTLAPTPPPSGNESKLGVVTDSADRLATGQPSAGPMSEVSAWDLLNRAKSARSIDTELMRRAGAGDYKAMFALKLLDARCGAFLTADDSAHPRHELARYGAEGKARAAAEKALNLMTAYCDLPYVAGDRRGLLSEFVRRLSEAAKAGDLTAQAALLFQGMGEEDIIHAYQSADDPWIVESALHALGRNNGPIAREIEAAVFPESMRKFNPDEIRLIREAAARWMSCQSGRYCGPNEFEVLRKCYYGGGGDCPFGLDEMSRIQQRDLSGYQFDLMQNYIAAVNARLRRGP